MLYLRGEQTVFLKDLDHKYFSFEYHTLYVSTTLFLLLYPKSSHGQYINKWSWLCYGFIHRNNPWPVFGMRDEVCWISVLDPTLCFCFFVKGV